MIKMLIMKFLSNLPQPPRNNPWLRNPTNKNFRTQFHQQCDCLLGFQVAKKINNSILEKNGKETTQMQRMIHMKL
jgi:hypothetical protein